MKEHPEANEQADNPNEPGEPGEPGGDHGLDADRPSELPAEGWKDVLIRVKNQMRDDHVSLSAAGVAFFGFLSIIPGLAAFVSLYGLFANPDQVRSRVEQAFGALPSDARHLLTDQLSRLTESSRASLGFGLAVSLALALWSASSGVAHLIEAINLAYNEQQKQGFLKRRGTALLFTFALLVVGIVAAAGIGLAANVGGSNSLVQWVVRVVTWLVVALLFIVILSVLYRFGPDRDDPKWRWVTPGSVTALVLWVAISVGFQFYVANFGSYNKTYGSLAAIVVMLFWLFLSALVVLVGAELNSELEHQTARDSTVGKERPLGTRDAYVADTVGRRT